MAVDSGNKSSPALPLIRQPDGQASSDEGLPRETGVAPLRMKSRVSFFIDGFNLYHGMDEIGDNRIKWVDLRSLCASFLRENDQLADVYYFTALNTWDAQKRHRHLEYVTALEAMGVVVIKGAWDNKPKFCWEQKRSCRNRSEKRTDVGIAVTLIADGFEDRFDKAFLVSADSDHIPLADRFRRSLPLKRLFLLAPPNRLHQARDLSAAVGGKPFQITPGRLRQHQLPDEIRTSQGRLLASRPAAYGQHRPTGTSGGPITSQTPTKPLPTS